MDWFVTMQPSSSVDNAVPSANIEEEEIEVETSTTYLAVTHHAKRLACACWDEGRSIILLGDFVEHENDDFSTLQRLKHQLNPQTVICCSSASEALIDAASKPLIGSAHEYPISTLTNISFSVERGRQKLLGLGAAVHATIDISAGGFVSSLLLAHIVCPACQTSKLSRPRVVFSRTWRRTASATITMTSCKYGDTLAVRPALGSFSDILSHDLLVVWHDVAKSKYSSSKEGCSFCPTRWKAFESLPRNELQVASRKRV